MDSLFQSIEDWLKEVLISGIMDNLSGAFDSVNQQVGQITANVSTSPASFLPSVYALIRTISENVILPVAGIILTFIACYELIQLVISHNNLANIETWIFWKWVFKTFVAVCLISNTFNITMAVFDVGQWVVQRSGSIISGSTAIDDSTLATMRSTLETLGPGTLLGIFLQSFIVQIGIHILSIAIFVIINGRMIEIYLMASMAPIPFATFGNKAQSMMGQNYLRSLFALAFQGFLIMICVGIYAVLITRVAFTSDITGSLWSVLGYTVLLAFTLFKTGTIAKSILHAH